MVSWTIAKAGGPKHDGYPAAVAVRNKLYSFGGYCDGMNYNHMGQMDVHVFNTLSLSWKKIPPVKPARGDLEVPSRCCYHTAVLIENTVYIWGGSLYCNVLYAFDVDTHKWFKPQVSGTVPEARANHSACVLRKVMFIHGGYTQHPGGNNDMYKLDTTMMVWSVINTRGNAPPAIRCHSATIIGTKMYVFGGIISSFNIMSVFDTETNLWLNTPSAQLLPERRWYHSAFVYNGELYIFGGRYNNQTFNDLWKFSPESFSWKKVEPNGKGPPPKPFMCCCMVGDRIILFGGYNTPNLLYVLDFSPSLKMLCKLALIQYDLEQSELPHDIRWELAAMTNKAQTNNTSSN